MSTRRRKRNDRGAIGGEDPASRSTTPKTKGLKGGQIAPLGRDSVRRIDKAAREVLSDIGVATGSDRIASWMLEAGAGLSPEGRLTIHSAVVDDAIADIGGELVLHGQHPGHELNLSDGRVHVGSGGAAPNIVDSETGVYRPSNLKDLHDAARLVDALDNIHFFSRPVVARDMPNERLLDINTAYACLAGTAKHICTSASRSDHVQDIADICSCIAGSLGAFVSSPFLSLNVNHVAPPLRLADDACEVLAAAARLGIPVHVNTFSQVGASCPVTVEAALTQVVAETLAGVVLAWAANRNAKVIFGPRTMVTDLRTGAMSGGSGEQALFTAAAVQMSRLYGLPHSTIAGATDSKIADAQSGYEKALTVATAAHAGSNMITQASGTQGALMACSLESFVIDNDMLGAILRSLAPVDRLDPDSMKEQIKSVVFGEGHYLGSAETRLRMKSDFLYPRIADRRSHPEWEQDGSTDVRMRARKAAKEMLKEHRPMQISEQADRKIRNALEIRLARRT